MQSTHLFNANYKCDQNFQKSILNKILRYFSYLTIVVVRVETDGDNSLRENCHSRAKHTMTIITNCHETLNRL